MLSFLFWLAAEPPQDLFGVQKLWIGFGFTALLLAFFIIAFFRREQLTEDQRRILRFLAAMCAGFGAFFITGEALVKFASNFGEAWNMTFSGTGGAALFFIVWNYFLPPPLPPEAPKRLREIGWKVRRGAKLETDDIEFLESLPPEIYTRFQELDATFPGDKKGEDYTKAVEELARKLSKIQF